MRYSIGDLNGMSLKELQSLYQSLTEYSIKAGDNSSLQSTVPGKKLLKRLGEDLVAIRSKYMYIKGTDQEILREFNRMCGREFQIHQEIGLLSGAEKVSKDIANDIELVNNAIENKRKQGDLSR